MLWKKSRKRVLVAELDSFVAETLIIGCTKARAQTISLAYTGFSAGE